MKIQTVAIAALLLCAQAAQAAPEVAVSIRPLHSLLSALMRGVAEPRLLLRGAQSPHTYSLRPSDAALLARADLVVWVGPELEIFLERPLGIRDGETLSLLEHAEVEPLPYRQAFAFETERDAHGADHARDAHHDEHGHTGHGHAAHHKGHAHEGHAHAPGQMDPHVWLDPLRAIAIADVMERTLARMDPEHAGAYRENAQALAARLRALHAHGEALLAPAAGRGFLMLHDAWQYLDTRYGLRALGALRVNLERAPSAHRLAHLAAHARAHDARCLIAEPQFSMRPVEMFARDIGIAVAVVDPIGMEDAPGPELYFKTMRRNFEQLRACLAPEAP